MDAAAWTAGRAGGTDMRRSAGAAAAPVGTGASSVTTERRRERTLTNAKMVEGATDKPKRVRSSTAMRG